MTKTPGAFGAPRCTSSPSSRPTRHAASPFKRAAEISPNVASYGAVLGALHQWQGAVQLLAARGLQPDLICFNAMLRSAPWQLAVGTVEGNAITFNSMLSACGRSGQWQLGGRLLARMRLRRVANEISLGAFVAACGSRGQWPRALEACGGLKASAVTFNAAISAL